MLRGGKARRGSRDGHGWEGTREGARIGVGTRDNGQGESGTELAVQLAVQLAVLGCSSTGLPVQFAFAPHTRAGHAWTKQHPRSCAHEPPHEPIAWNNAAAAASPPAPSLPIVIADPPLTPALLCFL